MWNDATASLLCRKKVNLIRNAYATCGIAEAFA